MCTFYLCVSKTLDGVTTGYIVDPSQSVYQTIQERSGGSITQSYAHGVDRLEVNPQSLGLQFPVSGGSLFYLPDRLGSVRGLTNGSGVVEQTMNYDAFGNQQ